MHQAGSNVTSFKRRVAHIYVHEFPIWDMA